MTQANWWGVYTAVVVVLVGCVVWAWAAPIKITLTGTHLTVGCAALLEFVPGSRADPIPHSVEVSEWALENYPVYDEGFAFGVAGIFPGCAMAQQQRATAVELGAIGTVGVAIVGAIVLTSRRRTETPEGTIG